MKNDENKNIEFEIQFYEGVLECSPDFVEALMALGDLYTRAGRYEDGMDVDKHLARLRPKDATVLYNLGCSYSLLGHVDKSLEMIKRALVLGYDNLEFLQMDEDLKNLRADSTFQDYWKTVLAAADHGQMDQQNAQRIFKDQ